ncbi:hypothetical protein P8452_08693 [Trifolium repens]|nr:hypothetical protein P8452_08693 [Trifolium repens]
MASPITSYDEKNERNEAKKASFEPLPESIRKEIVAIVGSKSVADLYNFKMTSKFHRDFTDDEYVLKRVSFEKSRKIQWEPNESALSFLKCCEESGNLQVLWSEGLRDLFNYPIGNWAGLEKLKSAAEGGYNMAKYVYGLIMLSSENDESRNEGIKHIRYLRMNKCLYYCRRKMYERRSYFWRYNGMLVRNETPVCKSAPAYGRWQLKQGLWVLLDDEDDDLSSCEYCRCDEELKYFYSMFRIPYIE